MDIPGGNQAALAVAAALLGIAGLLGLVVVDDDSGGDDLAASSTPGTTEPTTTTTPGGGTGATTLPGSGAFITLAPTTTGVTTTTRPATATTARATTATSRATTTSTAAGPSTTVASGVCGTGRASVAFTAKDLDTNALSSSFTPQATVDNQVSAPIEVEAIVLEVVYPGGETRTVRFTTAGTVIGPGTSASFTAEKITTPRRYESVRFTEFTYFTSGQPTACRVTTP